MSVSLLPRQGSTAIRLCQDQLRRVLALDSLMQVSLLRLDSSARSLVPRPLLLHKPLSSLAILTPNLLIDLPDTLDMDNLCPALAEIPRKMIFLASPQLLVLRFVQRIRMTPRSCVNIFIVLYDC